MNYNKQSVEFFGNLVCAGFYDIFVEHKQPQVVFQMEVNGATKQIRVVMIDNWQHVLTKEDIADKIADIQSRKTDVGFSYTSDGLRIIIVPEEMSIMQPGAPGVPFGTGRG